MKKFLIILCFFVFSISFSQENDSIKKDLKVGLVLSGGGAKGFAHIGVLKVLEEAGIRVDYIGGTSMGAIIGSLYASGYTANEIDSIIRSTDFNVIMLDEIPRKAKPFYEKQNGEKHALTLPFKKGKIGLPKAVSKGQNVLNMMTELLEHVDTITDFNKLPIPFVCIATNIETGEKEVLSSGFLPRAVQASGAFPTLLEPIEIDGNLLVDGGIVNNYPVDEVIKLGADIIIGVQLGNELVNRDELNSAIDIVNQIMSFQIYSSYKENIKNTDILVTPDMTGYTVTSFDYYDDIYALGEEAARLHFDDFVAVANQQTHKRAPFKRKERPNEIVIKSIEIEGNQDYTLAYVKSKMRIKSNDTITYSSLIDGINNLSATGNFTNIQYKVVDEDDGSIVQLKLKQNEISTYIKLAVHYDELYKTSILVNLTSKHLLMKNDVFSVDLILGDNIRYNFDYFIDNGSNWSFGLKSRYNRFNTSVDFAFQPEINKVDLKYRDFTNQLYIQTVLNEKFALGIGAEHKRITAYTETFLTTTVVEDDDKNYFDKSDYLNFISYIKFDTYDQKYFQKEGVYFGVDFRWYLFSTDYDDNFNSFSQLQGKFGFAHTFFNKLTMHIVAEAGLNIGDNNNDILNFHLGGYGENFVNTFVSFYGYDYAALTDRAFVLTALKLRYEIFKSNYVMATANAARVENDLINEGRIFEDTKLGFGLGYGIDSFLGPIELNYTYSPDTDKNYLYFNLGYWF